MARDAPIRQEDPDASGTRSIATTPGPDARGVSQQVWRDSHSKFVQRRTVQSIASVEAVALIPSEKINALLAKSLRPRS